MQTIREVESDILTAEGPHHVGGRYFASAEDADKARRIEAERRIREHERVEAVQRLFDSRWEITNEGLWALSCAIYGEDDQMPCLIGHDGVCRTHDEPCAWYDRRWVCLVGRVAS